MDNIQYLIHFYHRHLRLKHRETIRTCRGPFGETDQFRCNQCEDSFATQDELIYHSAIHATQNLICPLCEEKFEDVDAVTAHIKSHSTGMLMFFNRFFQSLMSLWKHLMLTSLCVPDDATNAFSFTSFHRQNEEEKMATILKRNIFEGIAPFSAMVALNKLIFNPRKTWLYSIPIQVGVKIVTSFLR